MSDLDDIMGLLSPVHTGIHEEALEPVPVRNGEFYHGTSRELHPGDQVLPWQRLRAMGLVEGEAPHGGSHVAWAHENADGASAYGTNVYRVRGDGTRLSDGRVRGKAFTVLGRHE